MGDPFERRTFGRTPILTAQVDVTDRNIVEIVMKAAAIYNRNKSECEYLYQYYKGRQPILMRQKFERPEIMNIVVENRAYEIVTFKTGRFLYKDVQYTNRSENNVAEVDALNRAMYAEGKAGKDRTLVDWFHICGHSYRMVVDARAADGVPFHIYTIDPRRAFVIYADTVEQTPLVGVYVTTTLDEKNNKKITYTAYTKDTVYTIIDDEIKSKKPHLLGDVPIVEYPANNARLGCFEIVTSLLNAINNAQSNRLDGVEQFIQALLVFKGLDIEDDDLATLKREGAICLPNNTDMDYLTKELNQSQVQTLVDDLYQAVLTICGMPNRNGGSSTSDTKGAVVLRDGWSSAAIATRETKQYFEAAERRMLTMALRVFNVWRDTQEKERTPLTMSDIDVHFDEGEYENTLEKSQVFTTLLGSGWVDPKDAFAFSNITNDPEAAYIAGKKFHAEQTQEELDRVKDIDDV